MGVKRFASKDRAARRIHARGPPECFARIHRLTLQSVEIFETLIFHLILLSNFRSTQDEKSAIQAQLKAMDAQKEQNRAQLKAIRDKCQYVKIEDIDSAVQRLEEQMAHTTMTLNEEKKIVQQVK